MSDNNSHRPNAAVCVGDIQSAKDLLHGLCGELIDNGINVHVFSASTLDYTGEPHDIGQASIFTLPNYDMLDVLVTAPFFLSKDTGLIESVINRALDAGVPVITIGAEHDGCYCVTSDYTAQVENICEHFIKRHKCREINFISGIKGEPVAEARLAGYRLALEKNGIPYEPERVYYGDFWDAPTINAVNDMLSGGKPLPEAIVCANDTMALAVISRLDELGYKVPDDVLVSGMDCIPEAEEFITTVKLMGKDTGHTVGKQVSRLLKGEKIEKKAIVKPHIQLGYSCGCFNDKMNISIEKRHALYEELADARKHSQLALKLNQEITNSSNFEQAMENIGNAVQKIWANHLWLCLCEDYLKNIDLDNIQNADDAAKASMKNLHRGGYSKKMYCPIIIRSKRREEGCLFDTAEMLPDFYGSADTAKCILYSPIHFKDISIGYIAFDFFPWSDLMYLFNIVTMGISDVLESVRRQSELYAYAKKIDEMYITDPLTGLYNRRGFFRLYKELSKDREHGKAVISIDLDNLKQINDNFGHKEGDNAITVTSNALKAAFAQGHISARFGGDEFVVYGECKDEKEATEAVERINQNLSDYNRTSDKPYKVRASIGWCLIPTDSQNSIDYYINTADAKMYTDKEQHKRKRSRDRG